ncbi:MAG: CBS domain-containing protein [Cellulomonas sp.]|nr:CBS domain-containing protein [Cellulomonas sp.]
MRARELAQPVEVVGPTDDVATAMRLVPSSGLPGLVVAVGDSLVVVPASQVLRVALPRYVLDDPALAWVWDEASADRLAERLAGLRVADLLGALETDADGPSAVVDGDATAVEVAAVMAAEHIPLVLVVDGGVLVGAVTASALIAYLSR